LFDEALDYYLEASAMDDKNPEPWAHMGEVYLTQSRWRLRPEQAEDRRELAAKATEMFEASLARNPYQTQVLLGLGKAWQLLDNPQRALEAYDRARTVDPNHSGVYMQLGLFYRQLEDETNAVIAFQKSEELNHSGLAVSRSNLEEFLPRP
jgi:tetratricopeptide (TPR) repeat protein